MSLYKDHLEINKTDNTAIYYGEYGQQLQPRADIVTYSPPKTNPSGKTSGYGHLILKVPAYENESGYRTPKQYQIWWTYDDVENYWVNKDGDIELRSCDLFSELPIG